MNLVPFPIKPFTAGLQKNKKPLHIMDNAFQTLENAYIFRETVKKREGIKLAGRLRRVIEEASIGNSGASPWTFNLYSVYVPPITPEANAEIEPGSVLITIQAGPNIVFTDQGDGTLTSPTVGNSGYINYLTGGITLTHTGGVSATVASFNYFPSLPVMGIKKREIIDINISQSILFDTKYSYTYDGNNFNVSSTTNWSGDDSNFFWSANIRGSDASERLFFVTNFTNPASSANNRIRYTSDAVTWTDFSPPVNNANTTFIFQCKLIVQYYGRTLFFYTYEGATAGTSSIFANRCRFSQVGNPIQPNTAPGDGTGAWLSDVFGKGGFIDAPTNESIVSLKFFKNTLIVFFERSTWNLRYVGEYGLPFIWERISSDFGSESTHSTILFDEGVLAVGNRAIISSSGHTVDRIDLEIPDEVFRFHNEENGKERVQGERDFIKEVVYWTYSDGGLARKFPNRVLLYNYRNNTFAIFRDNVTAIGELTTASGDSWDLPISWDSITSWNTIYQGELATIISGNQQGFIHFYQTPIDGETTVDSTVALIENESLSISDITLSDTDSINLEVINHNLEDLEIIYVTGLNFVDTSSYAVIPTDLNDSFYQVSRVDSDNITLTKWDFDSKSYVTTSHDLLNYTPDVGEGTYVGGGKITLIPKMDILTKDFNPMQLQGLKTRMSYLDINSDGNPGSMATVNIFINASKDPATRGNLLVGNQEIQADIVLSGRISNASDDNPCVITSPNHGLLTGNQITIANVSGMTELNGGNFTITFIDVNSFSLDGIDASGFTPYTSGGNWLTTNKFEYYIGSQYSYHRFYATCVGQFITVQLTYDDDLMNQFYTHQGGFEMNELVLWMSGKGGGRIV